MDELRFHRWLEGAWKLPEDWLGIGDDAAVIPLTGAALLCTDTVAQGTHFVAGTDPVAVGHKAAARNLSDLAAMGAEPVAALVSLVLPRDCALELPERIIQGCRAALDPWDCPVVGGDTTTHEGGLVVNVTLLGRAMGAEVIRRSGARVGDVLIVSGQLGGSLLRRHLTIQPRLNLARTLMSRAIPHAMIDVSDGLLLDLQRLVTASQCGFKLDASRIPIHTDTNELPGDALERAFSDGEDFELLFAMDPLLWSEFEQSGETPVPLTAIGVVTAQGQEIMRDGLPWWPRGSGYVHH